MISRVVNTMPVVAKGQGNTIESGVSEVVRD